MARGRKRDEATESAWEAFRASADTVETDPPSTPDVWVAYLKESLSRQITEAIETRMERQHITQSLLARRMGVTEGRVSQLLSGSPNMTLQTIAQLVTAVEGEVKIEVVDRSPVPGKTVVDAPSKTPWNAGQ